MNLSPQDEQEQNVALQFYYPLGRIQAVWDVLEGLRGSLSDVKERAQLGKVLDALDKLDTLIRKHRYYKKPGVRK